jgi:hypothetical protein
MSCIFAISYRVFFSWSTLFEKISFESKWISFVKWIYCQNEFIVLITWRRLYFTRNCLFLRLMSLIIIMQNRSILRSRWLHALFIVRNVQLSWKRFICIFHAWSRTRFFCTFNISIIWSFIIFKFDSNRTLSMRRDAIEVLNSLCFRNYFLFVSWLIFFFIHIFCMIFLSRWS